MALRLFEEHEHAVCYQKYRLQLSEELIQEILGFLGKKKQKPFGLTLDVGCGSGQGTVHLAPHFQHVIGIDVSPAQLEMARLHACAPNITYRQCVAEELPVQDESCDLVTALSAAHWFDWPRFLCEAQRVLKPAGCLVMLCFKMDMKLQYGDASTEELNSICQEFYSALSVHRNPCMGRSLEYVYKEMFDYIPYAEKEWYNDKCVRTTVPLSSYIGLIESFSTYRRLLKVNPEEARRLSQDTTQRLLAVMGASTAEAEVTLFVKYYFILARKPAEGVV